MSDIVSYERQGATAMITLNRPDSMNAFNKDLRADLQGALQTARDDNSVRVVVLTGVGRCFSSSEERISSRSCTSPPLGPSPSAG